MKRRIRKTILMFAGLALAGTLQIASAEEPEALAEVYVRVEDHGRAVPGLAAENFRVFEGVAPAAVRQAEPAGAASVVLLVENSRASWRYLAEVNSAMSGFLEHAPERHSYSLVSYTQDPKVEEPLTKEAWRVASAYVDRKQSAWSDVAAYDALDQVLQAAEELPGFRVVVMIGSGEDSFSRATFQDMLHRLESTNVVVYTIQLGGSDRGSPGGVPEGLEDLREILSIETTSGSPPPDLSRGAMILRAIAERSGGEFYCPDCEAGYKSSVEDILDSLDRFYRVSYVQPTQPAAGFVDLRVQAFRLDDDVRRDFRVEARPGRRF